MYNPELIKSMDDAAAAVKDTGKAVEDTGGKVQETGFKFTELRSKLELVRWALRAVGDAFEFAKEGAVLMGDESAEVFDEYEENVKSLEDSLKILVATGLLPFIEAANESTEAGFKWTDALEIALPVLGLVRLGVTGVEGAIDHYSETAEEATETTEDWNARLADTGLRIANLNALDLGEAAEEFDSVLGPAISDVNAAMISLVQSFDHIEAGFKQLGLNSDAAALALINYQEAQGLLTAEQADSERLMIALGVAIRDGLIVDYAALAVALGDSMLSQEEFADLLGDTGDAATDAGDDMDYLADKISSIPSYKLFTLEIDVIGDALPGFNFTDPSNKGTGAVYKAGGGPVWADQPYIVGERGPELFVPNSNGTIVPNNQINVAAPQVIVILDGEEIAARVMSRVGGAARSARSAGAWVTGE
jgi:hypothetical protein